MTRLAELRHCVDRAVDAARDVVPSVSRDVSGRW